MKMLGIEKVLVNTVRKGEANAARVRVVLDGLERGAVSDVLELGCGIGVVSAFLAEECGLNVVGTDFDAAQIALARERFEEREGLRFEAADATRLEFDDDSFDLVVSQHVFHHIPSWRDAVREIGRVLRPGGLLIWDDVAVRPMLRPLFFPWKWFMAVYTFEDVEAAFGDEGFSIVSDRMIGRGPFEHHFVVLRK